MQSSTVHASPSSQRSGGPCGVQTPPAQRVLGGAGVAVAACDAVGLGLVQAAGGRRGRSRWCSSRRRRSARRRASRRSRSRRRTRRPCRRRRRCTRGQGARSALRRCRRRRCRRRRRRCTPRRCAACTCSRRRACSRRCTRCRRSGTAAWSRSGSGASSRRRRGASPSSQVSPGSIVALPQHMLSSGSSCRAAAGVTTASGSMAGRARGEREQRCTTLPISGLHGVASRRPALGTAITPAVIALAPLSPPPFGTGVERAGDRATRQLSSVTKPPLPPVAPRASIVPATTISRRVAQRDRAAAERAAVRLQGLARRHRDDAVAAHVDLAGGGVAAAVHAHVRGEADVAERRRSRSCRRSSRRRCPVPRAAPSTSSAPPDTITMLPASPSGVAPSVVISPWTATLPDSAISAIGPPSPPSPSSICSPLARRRAGAGDHDVARVRGDA